MKKVILAILVGILVLSSPSHALTEFQSILPIKNYFGQIICTAFVINQTEGYVMTADHCMDSPFPLNINGQPAEEVDHNSQLDIAIMKAPGVKGIDPLQPNLEKQKWGAQVYMVGYAEGRSYSTVINSTVVFPELDIDEYPGKWIMLSPEAIAGMSGGPILDQNGRVVAIVQLGGYNLSISRPLKLVKDLIDKYWELPQVESEDGF